MNVKTNQFRPINPFDQSEEVYSFSFKEISDGPQLVRMARDLSNLLRIHDHTNETPDLGEEPPPMACAFDGPQMMIYHCEEWELIPSSLMNLGLL